MTATSRFIENLVRLFIVYLSGLLLFIVFRTTLLFMFGDFKEIGDHTSFLPLAYWVGFRIDTTVMTYGLLPLFIMNYFVLIPGKSEKINSFLRKFTHTYIYVLFIVFFWVLIVDFFFYKFFQSHINTLFFGIVDDDTVAVLESVWKDYPVLKIIVLFFTFLLWVFLLVHRLKTKNFSVSSISKIPALLIAILIIPLYILGLRGSTGTFPVSIDDTTISPNTFVNSLTMNGVFSLKEAFVERSKQKIDTDVYRMLNQYGFTSPEEAIALYTGLPVKGNLSKRLLRTTPEDTFLLKNPPNVIFIQMESMSNYYLDLHSPKMNLLGQLEKELPNCYLFRNFFSCTNGTIHTLEGLMVNSPKTPLSQSSYMDRPLSSSSALPFKKSGYTTHFITGAKLGWRNLDKFTPKQYFDFQEGSSSIMSKVPGAQECEWGVFDEFMFDRIFQLLEKSGGNPQFVFAMSTTNHTPFELPTTYKPFAISFSDELRKKFRCPEEIAQKNFTNYQYANHSLGKFIEKVRNSPWGKNTIIVASGDHNTLQVFDFTDSRLYHKRGVPCVMYIPEAYKPDSVDLNRFGSHKDIFPTIYNRALSNQSYVFSGNDLFTTDSSAYFYSVNNYEIAMNQHGAVILSATPLYFRWKNYEKKILESADPEKYPELTILYNKLRAHVASLNYFVQTDLEGK